MPSLLPHKDTRLLAFFLPQYHPIPENDAWWGKGFTEWTKVARGLPLFEGHQQPHLPADVGFYDLRVPEVREHQAQLARDAGLSGFIYYHYWFAGRRLLERPVNEILKSKRPDFPFCFCWANEAWSRNWDGGTRDVLMPQTYSAEDDLAHIHWLLEAFADDRYIKIDGRPLMFVYRPTDLPDMRRTAECWRKEARRRGFPDLYLCMVRSFIGEFADPGLFGLDTAAEFKPNGTDCGARLQSDDPLEIGYRLHQVWDYDKMVEVSLGAPLPNYPFFPGVCPSWDNSVRRKEGGMIFRNATPEKYGNWLRATLQREILRPQKESFVLINAWNEWAEGNHLEPCQRWGHGHLDATRRALTEARQYAEELTSFRTGERLTLNPAYKLASHVDVLDRSAEPVHARGWCVDADTLTPPDLLAYARLDENGACTLLAPLPHLQLPRPDVAAALGAPRSLLSGWEGLIAAPANAIVALRGRNRSATLVASLA
jgi:hypothetical protein